MCRQKSNFPTRKLCVSSFAELWSHARCEAAGEVFRGCYRLPTLRLLHCCPAGLLQPTEAGRRMEDLWPRLASPASLLSPDSREADRGCGGSATAAAPTASSPHLAWGRALPERPGPASHIYAATRSAASVSRRHQQELEKRVRGCLSQARADCSVCAGPEDSNSLLQFSNAKSRLLLRVASLSLANLSSNMAPPTFAEAWQPVTIDPGSLGDLRWEKWFWFIFLSNYVTSLLGAQNCYGCCWEVI